MLQFGDLKLCKEMAWSADNKTIMDYCAQGTLELSNQGIYNK